MRRSIAGILAYLFAAALVAFASRKADAGDIVLEAPSVFESAPVSEQELSKVVGREDLQQESISHQTSNVSNNSVNGSSVTGAVQFDDQALQNLSGVSLVNANTGNNVSMNSTVIVNLALRP